MEFSTKAGTPDKQKAGCVVVGVFEPRRLSDAAAALDRASGGRLKAILRQGDFELVLLPQYSHDLDDLHYYPVGEHSLCAIMPEAHPLAMSDAVTLEALADYPIVCGDGCPFWEAADRSFSEAGLSVILKGTASRAEWLFELVSAGVGIGIAARHTNLPAGLVIRPVEAAALTHQINLTTKRGRLYSPPVKAFVELALKPRPGNQPPASMG